MPELGRAAALVALVTLGLSAACGSDDGAGANQETLSCEVSYEDFAGPFLLNWCVGCHSSQLAEGEREGAPLGIDFDTLEGIRSHAERIRVRAVELPTMPPLGGPTAAERELLGKWLDCGAPAAGGGFQPPPPSGLPAPEPEPTGSCAAPRSLLPEEALPRCAGGTLDCVTQCGLSETESDADACRSACLAADTTAPLVVGGFPIDCSACSFLQLLGCADAGGCHEETARFVCCAEACSGDACVETECAGELAAFGLCVYYSAPHCVDYTAGPIAACFAPP